MSSPGPNPAYKLEAAEPADNDFTDVILDDDEKAYPVLNNNNNENGLLDQAWATPIVHHPPQRSWTRNPLVFVSVLAIGVSVFVGAATVVGLAAGMLKKGLEEKSPFEVIGHVGEGMEL